MSIRKPPRDEIHAAYRRTAKRCHPDMGGSEERMVAVIAAWEILSDRSNKAIYDAARASAANSPPKFSGKRYAKKLPKPRRRLRDHAKNGEDFVAWVERIATDVERNPLGRAIAGAAVGLVIGVALGAILALLVGVSVVFGSVIGAIAATIGGFLAAGLRASPPVQA